MPTPPEMLAGVPLGEGETQGLILIEGLADQLLEGTSLGYEDLIDQTVTLTVRLPRGETREFPVQIIGVESGRGSNSIDLGVRERTEIKAWWYGRPDTLHTDGYDMLVVRAIDQQAVPAVLETAESMNLRSAIVGHYP